VIGKRFVFHERVVHQLIGITSSDMPLGLCAQELDSPQTIES